MSGLTVYALKSCDTCRRALAELREAGVEPPVIDVRADGVPLNILHRFVDALGPAALVNRRSTTWRGLDEATQIRTMDPATTAVVLAEHPTLMKRPVIVAGETIHVGWTASVKQALLG